MGKILKIFKIGNKKKISLLRTQVVGPKQGKLNWQIKQIFYLCSFYFLLPTYSVNKAISTII